MKVAIMQPYLFPYWGYFELINLVDTFVFLDDVNFINRGWINRNRIVVNDTIHTFTLPLNNASQNKRINELTLANPSYHIGKLNKKLVQSYSNSSNFEQLNQILEECLPANNEHLEMYTANTIETISNYLGISTRFLFSSDVLPAKDQSATEKLVTICKELNAKHYLNLPGGKELYAPREFTKEGITLSFIKPNLFPYSNMKSTFEPGLSVIDVIAHNSQDRLKHELTNSFAPELGKLN